MNTTFSAPPAIQPASGKSVAALVLGLLGLLMCQILSPVAWYLGWSELRDIRAGLTPATGQDYATIGMVLGIVGTAIIALFVLLGMAALMIVLIVLGAAAAGAS